MDETGLDRVHFRKGQLLILQHLLQLLNRILTCSVRDRDLQIIMGDLLHRLHRQFSEGEIHRKSDADHETASRYDDHRADDARRVLSHVAEDQTGIQGFPGSLLHRKTEPFFLCHAVHQIHRGRADGIQIGGGNRNKSRKQQLDQ